MGVWVGPGVAVSSGPTLRITPLWRLNLAPTCVRVDRWLVDVRGRRETPEVRSRVELFEAIRRDHRREDLSIRQLAARHGVHRRTVRTALASAEPPPRKTPQRAAPKLDRVAPLIDAMLREDLTAPRKQQHTARRVLARLVDEHGMSRSAVPRSPPRPAVCSIRCSSRRPTHRAPRVRSTSPICGSTWPGSGPRCS